MTTDHEDLIDDLRQQQTIEDTAAADLLELHDRTGLNLHQAPNLLEFVEDRIARASGGDPRNRVADNHA